MRHARIAVWMAVVLFASSGALRSQNADTRATSAAAGGPASDVLTAFENNWDIPPYDCSPTLAAGGAGSTLQVTKTSPPCEGQIYATTFSGSLPVTYGLTYQIACDTSTDTLTSSFGACNLPFQFPFPEPCRCAGTSWDYPCNPQDTNPCVGVCFSDGPCQSGICAGGAFPCVTDEDCTYCSQFPPPLRRFPCTEDSDCNLGGCGVSPGRCSSTLFTSCVTDSPFPEEQCTGTCTPAGCGNLVMEACDDNLGTPCESPAQCGSCSNAPFQPCEADEDCDLGFCEASESMFNIDVGTTQLDTLTITTEVIPPPPPPPPPTGLPLLDRWRTGLLVVGLLAIGVVLILRRLF